MKADERTIRDGRPGILLVDDEESIHLYYKEGLEDEEGYIVHSAMNGKEALKIFDLAIHLGEPQVDLVILDINMPGMDGIEVLRQIKQKNPCLLFFRPPIQNISKTWPRGHLTII